MYFNGMPYSDGIPWSIFRSSVDSGLDALVGQLCLPVIAPRQNTREILGEIELLQFGAVVATVEVQGEVMGVSWTMTVVFKFNDLHKKDTLHNFIAKHFI